MAKKKTNKKKTISEAEQSAPNPFELFMCVMGVVTIFLIASLLFLDREGEFYKLISYFDNLVCLFFFIDFAITFYKAPKKLRYMFSDFGGLNLLLLGLTRSSREAWSTTDKTANGGVLDLLASIPDITSFAMFASSAIPGTVLFRYARVFRIFRVIRLLLVSQRVTKKMKEDARNTALMGVTALAVLGVILSTLAVLHFEQQHTALPGQDEATLVNAADTLWWSISTVATGGSENLDPITTGGRFAGVILKIIGITVFATIAAVITDLLRGLASPAVVATEKKTKKKTS